MFNWRLITAVVSALATTAIGVVAAYKSGYSRGTGARELNTTLGLIPMTEKSSEDVDGEEIQI